ncbi:TerB family tellurite resistance protein [Leptothrix discophora]|uniref:TerB family tellurite resistance protein n=1 Tax=Leptothrix discophora TaxID=89 RepID=A0ABT9G7B2_LEPDI|nr:TerB family tellurite resistance protein [Leptothrix discophora]MDP4302374.1 TerB family tellurite resistance protein [Leptothrix discophora]
MRAYPTNSPEAAARIVCLAMLADGDLTRPEIDVLEAVDLGQRLKLAPPDFYRVLEHLLDDLSVGQPGTDLDAITIDDLTIARLMSDVDDPALRRSVIELCRDVIESDAWISDGEALLLNAAVSHWGLQRAMFERRAA